MIQSGINIKEAKINVLGLTFKENCPDLRNSKVPDIIRELESYGIEVRVHDPLADPVEARREYGLELHDWADLPVADALVIAMAHDAFISTGAAKVAAKVAVGGCLVDVRAAFPPHLFEGIRTWRL